MNGYIVVESGRDITFTKEYYKGAIPTTIIYGTYKEALNRKKILLSYRSNYAKVMGITAIILKVQNYKII